MFIVTRCWLCFAGFPPRSSWTRCDARNADSATGTAAAGQSSRRKETILRDFRPPPPIRTTGFTNMVYVHRLAIAKYNNRIHANIVVNKSRDRVPLKAYVKKSGRFFWVSNLAKLLNHKNMIWADTVARSLGDFSAIFYKTWLGQTSRDISTVARSLGDSASIFSKNQLVDDKIQL